MGLGAGEGVADSVSKFCVIGVPRVVMLMLGCWVEPDTSSILTIPLIPLFPHRRMLDLGMSLEFLLEACETSETAIAPRSRRENVMTGNRLLILRKMALSEFRRFLALVFFIVVHLLLVVSVYV
jgi:hypothetical protein